MDLQRGRRWRLGSSKYLFEPVLERLSEQAVRFIDYLNKDLSHHIGDPGKD